MQAPKCSSARLPSWRSEGSKRASTQPREASVVAAAAATPTGATGAEGIAAAISATAIAAIFPTAGTGGALTAAATSVTTTISTAAAVTAAIPLAIATSAAAPGAAAATAIATTTTAATRAAGFGLVDAQGATHQLGALEGVDGTGFAVLVGQLHKRKAALSAGIPLQRQETVGHFTERGKQLGHVLLFRAEGEVANKNAHRPMGPIRRNFSSRTLDPPAAFQPSAPRRARERCNCKRT